MSTKNSGYLLDYLLHRKRNVPLSDSFYLIETAVGSVRLRDSGGSGTPIVFIPDGPCVIEHFQELFERLSPTRRVVCLDLPGFGYSFPNQGYRHTLSQGADAIHAVLASLNLQNVTLVASCVNGLYALAAAKQDKKSRIRNLVLSQTPSLDAMREWVKRTVPMPIRWPVLGQFAGYAKRKTIAQGWLGVAVVAKENRSSFRKIAKSAYDNNACFCFASVVQGVTSEPTKPAQLYDVRIPVTMVWGEGDPSHSSTDPQSLLELVPHAKIHRWPHVGHFADLEDPQRFISLLNAESA